MMASVLKGVTLGAGVSVLALGVASLIAPQPDPARLMPASQEHAADRLASLTPQATPPAAGAVAVPAGSDFARGPSDRVPDMPNPAGAPLSAPSAPPRAPISQPDPEQSAAQFGATDPGARPLATPIAPTPQHQAPPESEALAVAPAPEQPIPVPPPGEVQTPELGASEALPGHAQQIAMAEPDEDSRPSAPAARSLEPAAINAPDTATPATATPATALAQSAAVPHPARVQGAGSAMADTPRAALPPLPPLPDVQGLGQPARQDLSADQAADQAGTQPDSSADLPAAPDVTQAANVPSLMPEASKPPATLPPATLPPATSAGAAQAIHPAPAVPIEAPSGRRDAPSAAPQPGPERTMQGKPRVITLGDEPRRLPGQPATGFHSAPGVVVDRLPQIGVADATPQQTPEAQDGDSAPAVDPADLAPIQRYAQSFVHDDSKPLYSVVLIDPGVAAGGLDTATIAALDFPLTIAIDPTRPDAAQDAKALRAAGREVAILAADLPAGATPEDVDVALEAWHQVIPDAVAIVERPKPVFQNTRALAQQMVSVLGREGLGLVTQDRGFDSANQIAASADLPHAQIWRVLDAAREKAPVIERMLSRAGFEAARDGQVVVMLSAWPETLDALTQWGGDAKTKYDLAPVSAVALGAVQPVTHGN